MSPQPREVDIVLSGCGVRLIAEVGALAALYDAGYTVRRVMGTSGGAVVGALLIAGYTPAEMREVVTQINWRKFEDRQWAIWNGLCKGDYAYRFMRQLLDAKHVRTFDKLNQRLFVVASDITHGEVKIFGDDPQMEVAQAVRYSMSIPLFYRPLVYNGALMDDGGEFANFAINYFPASDTQVPALAVKVFDRDDDLPAPTYNGWRPIKRFISLQKTRIDALVKAQSQRHIHDDDWNKRTIQIEGCGISGINFSLRPSEKEELFQAGYTAFKTFEASPNSILYRPRI